MLIRLKKLLIQQIFPLSVKKFPITMRKQGVTGFVTASMFHYEVLEVIG